jgi:predicted kinase
LCSGKTTFAKELEKRVGGVRFSPDEWLTTISGDRVNLDDELFSRVHSIITDVWPKVVTPGVDVILDFGFWQRGHRDRTRALAWSLGAATRLYWVRCADDVARTHCRDRNLHLGRDYFIDDHAFDELRARFEPLQADENFELMDTNPSPTPNC